MNWKLYREKRKYKLLIQNIEVIKKYADPKEHQKLLSILDNLSKKELRRIKLLEIEKNK